MSSQRKRAERGRSGGNGGEPVEQGLWDQCKEQAGRLMELIQKSEVCKKEIFDLEAEYAAMKNSKTSTLLLTQFNANLASEPSVKHLDALSALVRQQVKLTEQIVAVGKTGTDGNASLLESLSILRALQHNNEGVLGESSSGPSRRGVGSREAAKSQPMDLDGTQDSPAPSPMVDKATRKDRLGGPSRGSVPPKDLPNDKQGSVGLEAGNSSGVEINAKGKIIFKENAEVAFKLKNTGDSSGNEAEWIQGVVVKVIGEGKSRRYDVQDPEPDEVTKKPGAVYRTSAASMVPIPSLGAPLPEYPKGKAVLARYPDTTTFYRAEVVGMNRENGNVVLRFEGEEDAATTWEVDRRFVLDHRG